MEKKCLCVTELAASGKNCYSDNYYNYNIIIIIIITYVLDNATILSQQ